MICRIRVLEKEKGDKEVVSGNMGRKNGAYKNIHTMTPPPRNPNWIPRWKYHHVKYDPCVKMMLTTIHWTESEKRQIEREREETNKRIRTRDMKSRTGKPKTGKAEEIKKEEKEKGRKKRKNRLHKSYIPRETKRGDSRIKKKGGRKNR